MTTNSTSTKDGSEKRGEQAAEKIEKLDTSHNREKGQEIITTQQQTGVGVVINTAEDAAMAYLREQISEKELYEYAGAFGMDPANVLANANTHNRIDRSFHRSLPKEETVAPESVDELMEQVEAKNKEREKVAKEAEEDSDTIKLEIDAETNKVTSVK